MILRQLLSNAIKFTKAGYVKLSYKIEENTINISIEDSGIGILKEDLDLLFERYYKSIRNQSASIIGTGIGLHLVKERVDALKGTITITSIPGNGTKIELILPLVESEFRLEFENHKPASLNPILDYRREPPFMDTGQLPRVLLVEDEAILAEYIRFLLGGKFDLEHCFDVDSALEKFREIEFDIILSDWTLPGKTGLDFLKSVRQKNNSIPFLFLTARTEELFRSDAFRLGADDFLQKPFDAKNLLSRIWNKIYKNRSNIEAIVNEKDSIYGDIHDILGGNLTDILLQINHLSSESEVSKEKLEILKNTALDLSKSLRTKLHDWEDIRNSEHDFELGWMSMLLRRYTHSGRTCRINLAPNLDWVETENWQKTIKFEIFRMTLEIANNDLKYGIGIASWTIEELTPGFKLKIKTKSNYLDNEPKGRGSRNLIERANRTNSKINYMHDGSDFLIELFVPSVSISLLP